MSWCKPRSFLFRLMIQEAPNNYMDGLSLQAIVGVVSIGQDITQHKSLEERKMRFMAVVSHELRSPIHGICGLSEALALSEHDPKRQKKLNMIKNCSTRLLDLVTDIMDISAMRSKTMKLNKEPCNL